MKCEQIRDILLTDYADGAASEPVKAIVDAHLASCAACREFYAAVKKSAIKPFENAGRASVPPQVWNAVRERIAQEHSLREGLSDFRVRAVEMLFGVPKPVWAFALLAVVFLNVAVLRNAMLSRDHNAAIALHAQMSELVSLDSTGGDTVSSGSPDFGSDLEQYFL